MTSYRLLSLLFFGIIVGLLVGVVEELVSIEELLQLSPAVEENAPDVSPPSFGGVASNLAF